MRKKTFFLRFLNAGTLVLFCLSLMLIAFGCKEKTEEVVFNLEEISDYDVNWPERTLPRALKFRVRYARAKSRSAETNTTFL